MRRLLPVLVLLLVVGAGCQTTTELTASPTETTPVELDLASSGVPCDDQLWVSFWGLSESSLWERDLIRVGYTVPGNTSFLAVTFVDGAVAGTKHASNTDEESVVVDGARLRLDSTFSREHTVEVVLYHDADGDGQLDRHVDSPCLGDDGVVSTGPTQVDFGRLS